MGTNISICYYNFWHYCDIKSNTSTDTLNIEMISCDDYYTYKKSQTGNHPNKINYNAILF